MFAAIEVLIEFLGGTLSERAGTRVKIELKAEQQRCDHVPSHIAQQAKKLAVKRVSS